MGGCGASNHALAEQEREKNKEETAAQLDMMIRREEEQGPTRAWALEDSTLERDNNKRGSISDLFKTKKGGGRVNHRQSFFTRSLDRKDKVEDFEDEKKSSKKKEKTFANKKA